MNHAPRHNPQKHPGTLKVYKAIMLRALGKLKPTTSCFQVQSSRISLETVPYNRVILDTHCKAQFCGICNYLPVKCCIQPTIIGKFWKIKVISHSTPNLEMCKTAAKVGQRELFLFNSKSQNDNFISFISKCTPYFPSTNSSIPYSTVYKTSHSMVWKRQSTRLLLYHRQEKSDSPNSSFM